MMDSIESLLFSALRIAKIPNTKATIKTKPRYNFTSKLANSVSPKSALFLPLELLNSVANL